MQFNVRLAGFGDAEGLRACIQAAYAPVAARGVALPLVEEGIEEDIATRLVWVAVKESNVIGGLIAAPVDEGLHVMNLAVHPEGQGHGVARALLSLAESYSVTHNLAEMRLATHRDMPENIAMYRHLGWKEDSRVGIKVVMIKSQV